MDESSLFSLKSNLLHSDRTFSDPKIFRIWSSVSLDPWFPIPARQLLYSCQQYLLNLILQSCGITE